MESTRYCNYSGAKFNNEITVIKPQEIAINTPEYTEWVKTMTLCEDSYFKLIERGMKPEQARNVLPGALSCELWITYNLREWRHFFNLRCDKHADAEIRYLSKQILLKFAYLYPVIFGDLIDKYLSDEELSEQGICRLKKKLLGTDTEGNLYPI